MMLASEEKALRALGRTGRRLVETRGGWAVLSGDDRRRRPQGVMRGATVDQLAAQGVLSPAPTGGYVLARDRDHASNAPDVHAAAPSLVVEAAGRRRIAGGQGFALLAMQARAGEGPLTFRQAEAGARLIADAEAAGRDPRLTMNWDAVPRDAVRRAGRGGGLSPPAMSAERRIRRVRMRLGAGEFGLVWSACVDGRSLAGLSRVRGLAVRAVASHLARALEAVADAYAR